MSHNCTMKRGEHFLVNEVLCVLGQEMQASMKTAAGTTKSRQKLGCVSSRLIGKVICCLILKLHSSVECKILMLFKDKKKHGTHFFFFCNESNPVALPEDSYE